MRTLDMLQVLRFVAALLVVVFHVTHEQAADFNGVFDFVKFGGTGVDIFFVLSGFIISATVLHKPVFDMRSFALNRFFRIYPTYWAVLTAAIILGFLSYKLTGSSGTYELVSPSSLTVSYLLAPLPIQIYSVAWTLTLEISFYVIFCISFAVAGLRGVMVTILIWYVVARVGAGFLPPEGKNFIWFFHSVVLEFLYGVIIAALWHKGQIRWALPVFILGIIAFAAAVNGRFEDLPLAREFRWGLPAALVIYGAVGLSWKVPRIALLAGDSSYILYLIHPLCITVAKVGAARALGVDVFASNVAIVLIVLGSVVLSMALAYWIERPYLRWYKGFIARLLGKSSSQAAPASKEA